MQRNNKHSSDRYLLVSPDYPPPLVGGSLVWMNNLIQNSGERFDVLTASLPPGQTDSVTARSRVLRSWGIVGSVQPARLRLLVSYLTMVIWVALRQVRYRYRAVVANVGLVGNSLLILLGKIGHFPVIVTGFAEEITVPLYRNRFKDRVKRWLMRVAYSGATGFVVVCHFCQRLLNQLGVSEDKVAIVPTCVSRDKIQPSRPRPTNRFRLLSVGRLIERKGFHDLIEAIAVLKLKLPTLELHIVGEGPMRPHLEEKIRRHGLESLVFLRGVLDDQSLAHLYGESDLFVLAHRMLPNGDTEGAPTVFCEAMASGLPVIGGTGGGADTIIEDGKTGYIIDASNIRLLEEKIREILITPGLKETMGMAGREKIEREHLPEKGGEKFRRALQRFSSSCPEAVFLDRDGTIIEECDYLHRIEDCRLIPGALEALRLLSRHEIDIYIVTNQSGIARGYYGEEDFLRLTQHLLDLFQKEGISVQEVLYCPHHPEAALERYRQVCTCRKPEPGLIKRVIDAREWSSDRLALIGDKNSDIEAGRRLGLKTYLVETGYGQKERSSTRADFIMPDLKLAVEHLIQEWRK